MRKKLIQVLAALTVQVAVSNLLASYRLGIVSRSELDETAQVWREWEDKVNA